MAHVVFASFFSEATSYNQLLFHWPVRFVYFNSFINTGTAFALLSIVSSLGMVISPLLLDAVYAKTVSFGKPQLTFYTAAAIYAVPMTLTW